MRNEGGIKVQEGFFACGKKGKKENKSGGADGNERMKEWKHNNRGEQEKRKKSRNKRYESWLLYLTPCILLYEENKILLGARSGSSIYPIPMSFNS